MIELFNRHTEGIKIEYDEKTDTGILYAMTFDNGWINSGISFSGTDITISNRKDMTDIWFHFEELEALIKIIKQIEKERDGKEINSQSSDSKT